MDGTLSSSTTPGQSGQGCEGNVEVLRIPQSSSISGTSLSDCFVSYVGRSLLGILPLCREKRSVYSSAPADWAKLLIWIFNCSFGAKDSHHLFRCGSHCAHTHTHTHTHTHIYIYVYVWNQMPWRNYEQYCCFEIFLTLSFDD